MSASATLASTPAAPAAPVAGPGRLTSSDIDASCRILLVPFAASLLWLVLGCLVAALAAIQYHGPGFLDNAAWLTLGRMRPASTNALVFGFASQCGFAVMIWLLCRLGNTRLADGGALTGGILFWNAGVAVGILHILAKGPSGFDGLEMPGYAAAILFSAFVVVALVAALQFRSRRETTTYVTQWHLLAALFWFAWSYSVANLLLFGYTPRGVLQSAVAGWHQANMTHLWLGQLGLGIIYYFLPKLLNRPLYSSYLAGLGFWTYALFATWSGLTHMVGGPLPAWVVSNSVGASIALMVPLVAIATNWWLTLAPADRSQPSSVPQKFICYGAIGFLAYLTLVMSYGVPVPPVQELTRFTLMELGRFWLWFFGFIAMVLFGAMHYILPRLIGEGFGDSRLASLHYPATAIGTGLLVAVLLIGGFIQGIKMNIQSADFIALGKLTVPFLGMATLALWGLLVFQTAFTIHVFSKIRAMYPLRTGGGRRHTLKGRRHRP